MVADVGAPNIAVHLDSYHMNIEEDAMALAVAACGDKLGCESMGAWAWVDSLGPAGQCGLPRMARPVAGLPQVPAAAPQ